MGGGVYLSNILFKENGHLTKISLEGLKDGTLLDNELVLISEHICSCEACAEALAESFNESELLDAPVGFEEEVLSKIKNKKESKNEFIFYSLRVAMAACIALVFVFSSALNSVANTNIKAVNVNPASLSTVNNINRSLNDFSQKIINLEVLGNEKEKK